MRVGSGNLQQFDGGHEAAEQTGEGPKHVAVDKCVTHRGPNPFVSEPSGIETTLRFPGRRRYSGKPQKHTGKPNRRRRTARMGREKPA
jgi:hypothetical protein